MGLGWIVKRMGVDMVLEEEEVVVVGLASKGAWVGEDHPKAEVAVMWSIRVEFE